MAIHPEASKYRVPYGQVLHRSGRLEEAAAQLALRGEGVPTISDPRLAAVATLHVGARTETIDGARLIQAGALAAGVAKLERALATDPSDAEAHRNLAVGLLRLGRGAEAIASMEQAARRSPSDPEVRFSLGAMLAAAGRDQEAEAAYLAALEIDPGHLDSLQNLANLRLRANRPGAALEDLRRLRAADPTRAAAWLGTAAAEVALGREAAALATLDEASSLLPQDWRIAGAWCRVASAARDPLVRDGARAVQRAKALVLTVRHPYLQATLAMALAETGDFAGAVEAQKRAITLTAPDSGAEFRATLERNLELYRRGEPCRDPGLN